MFTLSAQKALLSRLPFQLIQIKTLTLLGQHPKIAGMTGSHLIILLLLVSDTLSSTLKSFEQPVTLIARLSDD